ncbi:MAG: hypothetical protein HC774_02620 [Sphingomonadales bacterium]|nr:hypothetical protein [Sphingomonadales bacterium]
MTKAGTLRARIAAIPELMQRRPAFAAMALGLIAACAYPPLHLWPLGLAALAGFVWLIHTRAQLARRAVAGLVVQLGASDACQ